MTTKSATNFSCFEEVSAIDRDFPAKVIPDDGAYIMFKKRPGVDDKGNSPFGDLESMVGRLAKACDAGFDVYHACASFNDGSSRTAANAKSLRALFVDLDCDDEKAKKGTGYATKGAAKAALKVFCGTVALPLPLLVDSGGGLHAYWPLEEAVPASAWKTVAVQLKALCVAHGLNADHGVTADMARVLRPVGSYNRKYEPPRRVELIADAEAFESPRFHRRPLASFHATISSTSRCA